MGGETSWRTVLERLVSLSVGRCVGREGLVQKIWDIIQKIICTTSQVITGTLTEREGDHEARVEPGASGQVVQLNVVCDSALARVGGRRGERCRITCGFGVGCALETQADGREYERT